MTRLSGLCYPIWQLVSPTRTSVLSLHDLRVRRGPDWQVQLSALDLCRGEVAALVGPSGCGKTSLLLGLLGIVTDLVVAGERSLFDKPWPGSGEEVRRVLGGPVVLLLQDAKGSLDPLQKVSAQVQTVTGKPAADCIAALRSLGVEDAARVAGAYPHELSGGEAQKVQFTIALLRGPELLIADEPTASLDGASIEDFTEGLRLLQERHSTAALIATHDLGLVAALGARTFEFDGEGFVPGTNSLLQWPRADPGAVGAPVMSVRGLVKSYGSTEVLRGLDLAVHGGEVVAVVGPSGCGKSTLARILAGHLAADRGEITGGAGVQLLFQDAYASLTPHRTIRSLVDETRRRGFDTEQEAESLGLPAEKLTGRPAQLSGGERRRAALLGALSVEPSILVLDEPTASLDHQTAVMVMDMVMRVQRRRGLACLLITHDRSLATTQAHRVLSLVDGRLQ